LNEDWEDFSCSHGKGKCLCVGGFGGEQSGKGRASRRREQIAVSMRQLANQTVCPEQSQFASHGGGAATGEVLIPRLAGKEQSANVAVAEPGDGPLRAANGAQEGVVRAERMQSAVAAAVVGDGAAQWAGPFAPRGVPT